MVRGRFHSSIAAALGGLALVFPGAQADARQMQAAPMPQAHDVAASGAVSTVETPQRGSTRIIPLGALTLKNSHGDSASEVTNFTLTLIAEPGPPDRTLAVVNYDIYAYSQNDRGGGVTYSIDLLDEGGNVILNNAVTGRFMRDHCTYNGAEHYTDGPTVVRHNIFGAARSARVRSHYSASYEGRC